MISEAVSSYQTCPQFDGVVAGELPSYESSSCPVFRTERTLWAMWQNPDFRSQWNYVSSTSPTLSSSEEAALDRIMAYVDDLDLFWDELPSKRRTIAKGVFVAILNDFDDPGQVLSPQKVVTTFSIKLFPTPTTAPYCPSMTVTYPYASPLPTTEEIVGIQKPRLIVQELTVKYIPCYDSRCRYSCPSTGCGSGICDGASLKRPIWHAIRGY